MLCPYCKNEHPDQTVFCPITGQPLAPIPNITVSNCANCGASLPMDAQRCPVCGASVKLAGNSNTVARNTLWHKSKDYIKLVSFSFAALLILVALVLFTLEVMLTRIRPPFSATLPSVITPSMESIIQQLTKTVTNPPLTPSGTENNPLLTPSRSVSSQTQQATIAPNQSWKQGFLVYLLRIPSGFNSIYLMNLEKGSNPQLLLQPTTNQHYYGPWLSPDSRKVVFYDLNGSNGILDLQDLSVQLIEACNSPTYSPDGTQIICGSRGQFRILNAENGEPYSYARCWC